MEKTISGKVIKGDGYGRKLGFPTANLDRRSYLRSKHNFDFGVYGGPATRQKTGQTYRAAIVIGPNDRHGRPKLEAHLIDFSGNLYGEKLVIKLEKFIRPYKNFETEKELIEQIAKDVKFITSY